METAKNLNEPTIDALQQLIEGNLDAWKGFAEAAKQVDNPAFSAAFSDSAQRRKTFASTLQGYVKLNDETPEREGTAKGAVHRAWMKVRSALTEDDLNAMLDEAARGEEYLKEQYERLLKANPGNPLSDLLHEQYESIVSDYKGIDQLRLKLD